MLLHSLQQVEAYVRCFVLVEVAAELVSAAVDYFAFGVKAFLVLGWTAVAVLLAGHGLLVSACHWAVEEVLHFSQGMYDQTIRLLVSPAQQRGVL